MTTDELRAKFEAWAIRNICPDLSSAKNEVQAAWRSWRAAHASRDTEIKALRKDAERYRLLRSCSGYQSPFCVTQNIGHDWIILQRDELDEAIGAAMARETNHV